MRSALIDTPVVVITPRVAVVLAPWLRELGEALARDARRNGAATDPEVVEALQAIKLLARAERARAAAGVPQDVPHGIPQTGPVAKLAPVSTKEAAKRLGITDRGVRFRLERGTLAGERQPDGTWHVWLDDESEVA